MTRKHDAALVALITSIPALATKFYPGLAPMVEGKPQAGAYAVYYSQPGTDAVERQSGPALTQRPRWTIHCVGSTAEQAQAVNEAIKAKLVVNGFGVIPTVAGENPSAFWYSNPVPVQRDDDAKPPLFYVVAECGFSSDIL